MVKTYLLAFTIALPALTTTVSAADPLSENELSGYVIKLAEKTNASEPQSINVGGLVIAVVRDSGSRPPQNISVEASVSLTKLGVVRGTENDQGQALMGGGYNWYLFQPTKAGDATVKVAYTENGDGGKRVEKEFKLTVTAQ